MEIITNIIRRLAISGRIRPHRYLQSKTMTAMEQWLKEKRYLEGDMNMSKVAEQLGVSAGDLSYFCHDKLKVNFLSWRKELRIFEAKKIIRTNPELPMYIVSSRVGISNRSNFRKQFLEVTGITPTQWRNRFRTADRRRGRAAGSRV